MTDRCPDRSRSSNLTCVLDAGHEGAHEGYFDNGMHLYWGPKATELVVYPGAERASS